ncbi:unnamed protein product [Diplocarpon coronariae]|uniref:Uncharacterized protein n=1 Tax=Diplocarpon coronariae TaxID=2795749 RepID=A0A218YXH8_9HELO|nr:hypothetical protein B2J93_2602 [Marssonina coronariae]
MEKERSDIALHSTNTGQFVPAEVDLYIFPELHPVEKALRLAKIASKKDDYEDFRAHRKATVDFLSGILVNLVKSSVSYEKIFDFDSSPHLNSDQFCNDDDARDDALFISEDYAKETGYEIHLDLLYLDQPLKWIPEPVGKVKVKQIPRNHVPGWLM